MTSKKLHRELIRGAALVTAVIGMTAVKTSVAQATNPQQRLQQLTDATTLNREGLHPWHLLMTFSMNDLDGGHKENGMIEEWWVSPAEYRVAVTSPSLTETLPTTKEQVAVRSRESYLVDLLLRRVVRPIPYYKSYDKLTSVELNRTFGKAKLSCLRVGTATDKMMLSDTWTGPEYCTEPDRDVLRVELGGGHFADVRNRVGTFQGVEVALDHALSYDGIVAITGHVETLQALSQDQIPAALVDDKDSDREIPGVVLAGRILKREQAIYPFQAKQRHMSGSVVLAAVITKEGTVGQLEVIARTDPSFSAAAIDAVKKWRYDPYLLNGEPTEVQTTIPMNFQMNRLN